MNKKVLVLAMLAALGAAPLAVQAVDLSKAMDVQSRPGQPFRAVVRITDVPDPLTFDEIEVRNASPASYADAGLEYTDFIGTVRVSLSARNKKTGERTVLITSPKPPKGNFTVLVDLTWSGGRSQRDFAVFLNKARPAAAEEEIITEMKAPAPMPAPAARMEAPAARQTSPAADPVATTISPAQPRSLTIPKGATASGLAQQFKPRDVKLETFLAGLLSANSEAFIGNNINKLRAGALVRVPSRDYLKTITADESRDILSGVSTANFSAYKARLAGQVGVNTLPAQTGSQSGKLVKGIEIQDKSAMSPDKLALSKASEVELKAVQLREAKEAITRLEKELAAIQKQASGLFKAEAGPALSPSVSIKAPAIPATKGVDPSAPVETAAPEVAMTLKAAPVITNPAPTGNATASAGGSAEVLPSPKTLPIAPLPIEEQPPEVPKTLVERLLSDPADVFVQAMSSLYGMIAAGVLGLLALLALVASSRKKKAHSYRLEPDQDDDAGLVFSGDVDVREESVSMGSQAAEASGLNVDGFDMGSVAEDLGHVHDVEPREKPKKKGLFSGRDKDSTSQSKPGLFSRFSRSR